MTHKDLLSLLNYDPETGIFRWKRASFCIQTGDIAGYNSNGTWVITINNIVYSAAKLAWFYTYKEMPKFHVKQLNGIRDDLRLTNLQIVNKSQEAMNRRIASNNSTGVKGVTFDLKSKKYISYIKLNQKQITLGRFDSLDEAKTARQLAEIDYFGDHRLSSRTDSDKLLTIKSIEICKKQEVISKEKDIASKTHKEIYLTHERLLEILKYDPVTGIFTWINPKAAFLVHNSQAGTQSDGGYITINIKSKIYRAHRLAWFYTYGEWPPEFIDHVNGVRTDNRLINLRLATPAQNARNKTLSKRNTSGFIGVRFNKSKGKFTASITFNRKNIWIGNYDTIEEANAARIEKEIELYGEYSYNNRSNVKEI